jgi:hypothetical protein
MMAAYWVSIAVSSFVTQLVGFFLLAIWSPGLSMIFWVRRQVTTTHFDHLPDGPALSRISPPIFGPKKGKFHMKPDNFPTIQYILTFIVGCCTQKFPFLQLYSMFSRWGRTIVWCLGRSRLTKPSSLSFGSGVGDSYWLLPYHICTYVFAWLWHHLVLHLM